MTQRAVSRPRLQPRRPLAYLRDGVSGLPDVIRVSPVYETDPVGGPAGPGAYLNLVVELSTDRTPRELLAAAQAAEAAGRRVRRSGGARGPSTSTCCSSATRSSTTAT